MFDRYEELMAKVDRTVEDLEKRHREHLVCMPGCDACCREWLSFYPVEIAYISLWVARQKAALQEEISKRLEIARETPRSGGCPLLKDGRCLAYPVRPLLCRSHGLLLNVADPGHPPEPVRSCELNYRDTDPSVFDPSQCINQNLLSSLLFHVNGLFAREAGLSPDLRLDLTALEHFSVDFVE